MLFNLRLNKDIVRIPSFPARLRGIREAGPDSSRVFFYEISLNVDIARSFALSGITLDVEVLPRASAKFNIKPKTVTPATYSRDTKKLEKSRKAASKKRNKSRITRKKIDLTKYANNSSVSKTMINCEKRCRKTRGSSRRACMGVCRNIKKNALETLYSPSIVTSKSPFTPGKFSLAMSASISIDQDISYPFKPLSEQMILAKIDPGQILRYPIKRFSPAVAAQAQSVLFTPPKSNLPYSAFRVKSATRKVKFRIPIKESRMLGKSKFYLNVRLLNPKGVILDEVGQTIDHSKYVNDFITPRRPPSLKANTVKVGINSVAVKQTDRKATRLKVFRRVAPSYSGGSGRGSPWVEILDTAAQYIDDEMRFKDPVPTSGVVLYRAIALGANSRPTDIFSSATVLPVKELKSSNTTSLASVARYIESQNQVVIKVTDIPKDAVSASVQRYNVTDSSIAKKKNGTGQGFIYVGNTESEKSVWVMGDEDGAATFIDTMVKGAKKYRYVPIVTTKTGKMVFGTDSLIEVLSSKTEDAKVALKVGSPVVATMENEISVAFSLEATFTDFGFEQVRSSLQSADQEVLFANDVFDERSKFSQLINFLVERESYKTGLVESFGVYEFGEFSDNKDIRAEKNVSAPNRGEKYSYKVTALIRSAESMLQDLVQPSVDTLTLMKFSRSMSKFRNPMALQGTLQSTSRQKDFSKPSRLEPTDPFLAGRTNVESSYDVSVPIIPGKSGAIVTDVRPNLVSLNWNYGGNTAHLDQFQVFVCSNGGRQMVGVIHPDSDTVEYSFRHFTNGYSVPYFYEVHFIRLDYKQSGRIRSKDLKPTRFMKEIDHRKPDKRVVQL